jgi:hypothetical protein
MRDTTTQGNMSEAFLIAALMAKGFKILTPFGDGFRYDLVIDDGTSLSKVQCKTGQYKAGVITFKTCSNSSKNTISKAYTGEIDYFAVWCPQLSKGYLVPVNDVAVTLGTLRVDAPLNNQTSRGRLASVYEL